MSASIGCDFLLCRGVLPTGDRCAAPMSGRSMVAPYPTMTRGLRPDSRSVHTARASRVIDEGLLEGDFEGFEELGCEFVFVRSRRRWRQAESKLSLHYAYMPRARVVQRRGRCFLEVTGVRDSVLVEEITSSAS